MHAWGNRRDRSERHVRGKETSASYGQRLWRKRDRERLLLSFEGISIHLAQFYLHFALIIMRAGAKTLKRWAIWSGGSTI